MATTESPKMSPHSAKPRFEVRIMGAPLITGVDELEEQIAAARNDREVADFVDNGAGRSGRSTSDLFAQSALAFGPGERGDDVGEGAGSRRCGRLSPPRRRAPG